MIGAIIALLLFIAWASVLVASGASGWSWLIAILVCGAVAGIVNGIVVVLLVAVTWVASSVAGLLHRGE